MVLLHAIQIERTGNATRLLVERVPGEWSVLLECEGDDFVHRFEATGINKGTPASPINDDRCKVHHLVAPQDRTFGTDDYVRRMLSHGDRR